MKSLFFFYVNVEIKRLDWWDREICVESFLSQKLKSRKFFSSFKMLNAHFCSFVQILGNLVLSETGGQGAGGGMFLSLFPKQDRKKGNKKQVFLT